ncbi:PLD nuclease N-terminal domain-containing protein [Demequina silvatica]|uniref:PLD nuclease N-terminal domain-containing protein n=1 Tax=Demequina silvatica TaxID=1638988 RepID=UPI000784DA05|nr:PLD nuclease N-terminal domain-containing protein [Demequina silvatica]
MRLLPVLLYIAMTVYALADVVQQPSDHPQHLPKAAWILIILLVPWVGAGAWILLRMLGGPTQRPRPPAPIAPDDDPAYQVWLNEQQRRRRLGGE